MPHASCDAASPPGFNHRVQGLGALNVLRTRRMSHCDYLVWLCLVCMRCCLESLLHFDLRSFFPIFVFFRYCLFPLIPSCSSWTVSRAQQSSDMIGSAVEGGFVCQAVCGLCHAGTGTWPRHKENLVKSGGVGQQTHINLSHDARCSFIAIPTEFSVRLHALQGVGHQVSSS